MTGNSMRVGIGYDVHAFGERRPLFLGGVEIPHERGLVGHSDADVLVHALMDAIVGGSAKVTIGRLFPTPTLHLRAFPAWSCCGRSAFLCVPEDSSSSMPTQWSCWNVRNSRLIGTGCVPSWQKHSASRWSG